MKENKIKENTLEYICVKALMASVKRNFGGKITAIRDSCDKNLVSFYDEDLKRIMECICLIPFDHVIYDKELIIVS